MKNLLESYFDRLFPLNRSLTGNGVRETFNILRELVDFKITEVPSGTLAFDWTVPKEWNVNQAYIITPDGEKIADFSINNLHLVGYSVPFKGKLSWEELERHLHTLPGQPDAIPYITSYYKEYWGFCISQNRKDTLPKDGLYEIVVDSSLASGSMTVGEAVLKGKSDKEIFFTSYCCHPSMANNELSGMLALAFLYHLLKEKKNRKYTYRFYLAPETIGAIYNLSANGNLLKEKMRGGIVMTCCGDSGDITLKKSRTASYFDEVFQYVLKKEKHPFKIKEFFPMGSDERQYCSPGFNLPMVCLTRTMYGEYPQYHTSLDDKSIMDFDALEAYINLILEAVHLVENDRFYINTMPFGEPQLGKRGLYPTISTLEERGESLKKRLYLLNYSDGNHSLLQIANRLNIDYTQLDSEVEVLVEKGLLKPLDY